MQLLFKSPPLPVLPGQRPPPLVASARVQTRGPLACPPVASSAEVAPAFDAGAAGVASENTPRPLLASSNAPASSDVPSAASLTSASLGPLRSVSAMSARADFFAAPVEAEDRRRGESYRSSAALNWPAAYSAPVQPRGESGSGRGSGDSPGNSLVEAGASDLSQPRSPRKQLMGASPLDLDGDDRDGGAASPLLRLAAPPGLMRPRRLDRVAVMRAAEAAAVAAAATGLCETPADTGLASPRFPIPIVPMTGSLPGLSSELVAARFEAPFPPQLSCSSDASPIVPATTLPLVIIFHCEFSQHRGPEMLRAVRAFDRRLHLRHYPALSFPQLYVLHRGFRRLREEEPGLCEPHAGAYVAMDDPRHRASVELLAKERKRGMKLFRALRPAEAPSHPVASEVPEGVAAVPSRSGILCRDVSVPSLTVHAEPLPVGPPVGRRPAVPVRRGGALFGAGALSEMEELEPAVSASQATGTGSARQENL